MAPVAVKAFRLIDGKQHIHDGVDLKPGDQVLLNQNQATAFKDKLTPVDPGAKFKVMSDSELKSFTEKEANRRADRDAKAAGAPTESYET